MPARRGERGLRSNIWTMSAVEIHPSLIRALQARARRERITVDRLVKREGIELPSNFTATINVELRVGVLEETVSVAGESPVGRFERRDAADLPLAGEKPVAGDGHFRIAKGRPHAERPSRGRCHHCSIVRRSE